MGERASSSPLDSCSSPFLNGIIADFKLNYEPRAAAKKLAEWGLVAADNELICYVCRQPGLKLCMDRSRRDGMRWTCGKQIRRSHKKPRKCINRMEFRKGTIFSQSQLPLWKILAFVHLWVEKIPLISIGKLLGIKGSNCLVDWASFFREIICEFSDVPEIIDRSCDGIENEAFAATDPSNGRLSKRAECNALRDSFVKNCQKKGLHPTREFYRLAGLIYDQRKLNPVDDRPVKIKEEIDFGDYE